MIETLLEPFATAYMVKAIAVSTLVGAVCAALSCFVTLKGWSLMGDALSHAVVPGVALAAALGVPFALGAFGSGLVAAWCMGQIKRRTRLREDAVIGIVFTTFFAAGVLLISLWPGGVNLKTVIFGKILGIAGADALQVLAVAAVVGAVLAARWRDLALTLFDPAHARAIGLRVDRLEALLLAMLAATAVAALQAVGACLVVAMLVTPGATAYLLTDRFGRMLWLAVGIGSGTSAIGAYISYFLDGSTGGCIVVLQTLVFVTALMFAPRHGVLAARARGRRSVWEHRQSAGVIAQSGAGGAP